MVVVVKQSNLFDYQEGLNLRTNGMEAAAHSLGAQDWLERARGYAGWFAARYGEVTSDDVLKGCPKPDGVSPYAIGSLFKKGFRRIGYRNTEKASSHARPIGIWILND